MNWRRHVSSQTTAGLLIPVLLFLAISSSNADEAPHVHVTGGLSGQVQGGGSGGLGVDSERLAGIVGPGESWGWQRNSGPPSGRQSYSTSSFRFDIVDGEISLVIDASQVAEAPTSFSVHQLSVTSKLQASVEVREPTRYSFAGLYAFQSEAPGTGLLSTLELTHPATGATLLSLRRDPAIEVSAAEIDFAAAPRSTGQLEAGETYELLWEVSFANPIDGAATGHTEAPFTLQLVRVPEPRATTLACVLALGWVRQASRRVVR